MTSRKVDIMKNFEQICCGQPIEGMKGRPDGCIVDINDSGVSVCVILSILVDTFISKISFPMQPGPEIGSISDA